ncbi:hypothetical protein MXE27_00450 [Methanobacterium alcaliphilum]|nr:hypothetical protein [Methanobacterium alcaliphilum]
MKKIRRQEITNKKNTKTFKPKLSIIVILLVLFFLFNFTISAVSADKSTIYVNDSSGNDSWDGEYQEWLSGTINGPKKSIKNAIETVNDKGVVHIANGVYTGENNTNIVIDKNVTIIGESQEGTIIDAQKSAQIFNVNPYLVYNMDVKIQNLTLINGTADNGGAIYNLYGTLTVEDCTFIGNTATTNGGAINNNINGNCIITGSTFINNSAGLGGGPI